jgi:rRNA maturation endonuclease Nob1
VVAETLLQAAAPHAEAVPEAVVAPLTSVKVVCGACETVNDSDNAFCESCGTPIPAT